MPPFRWVPVAVSMMMMTVTDLSLWASDSKPLNANSLRVGVFVVSVACSVWCVVVRFYRWFSVSAWGICKEREMN